MHQASLMCSFPLRCLYFFYITFRSSLLSTYQRNNFSLCLLHKLAVANIKIVDLSSLGLFFCVGAIDSFAF